MLSQHHSLCCSIRYIWNKNNNNGNHQQCYPSITHSAAVSDISGTITAIMAITSSAILASLILLQHQIYLEQAQWQWRPPAALSQHHSLCCSIRYIWNNNSNNGDHQQRYPSITHCAAASDIPGTITAIMAITSSAFPASLIVLQHQIYLEQ